MAPVATGDDLTVDEDTFVTGNVAQFLANDTDVDNTNAQLMLTAVSAASHGVVVLNGDGTITFTPDADFNGIAGFDYTVSDGTLTDVGHVTITVNPVNDLPQARDDHYSVLEDNIFGIDAPGALFNDSDADGDSLSVVGYYSASYGTVSIYNSGAFNYTPAPNFNGTDSFVYKIWDGHGDYTNNHSPSTYATVTIDVTPVNDAPVAVEDTASTDEDMPLTLSQAALKSNDTDIDNTNAQLMVTAVSAASHGVVVLNGDGTVTFTPDADFNGIAGFDYTVSDGTLTDVGHVTITVNPVNDLPQAQNDHYSVAEDNIFGIDAPGALLNDSDPDGDSLSVVGYYSASHGTVSIYNSGAFNYTPAPNFNGTDSFVYKIWDGHGDYTSDHSPSTYATVTIDVTAVNDAPVAVDDTTSTDEDTPLILSQAALKSNDSDVDNTNAQLMVTAVSAASNGVVVLNGDGTVTFTPDADFNGIAGFDYTVSDGTLTDVGHVTITVNPVNDLPQAQNDHYSVAEDNIFGVDAPGALFNDSDADGDSLSVVGYYSASNGTVSIYNSGAFNYTPAPNFNGTDSFVYKIWDGHGDYTSDHSPSTYATVTIDVTPVNDAPVAVDDTTSTDEDTPLTLSQAALKSNDTDIDNTNAQLMVTAVSAASHGVVVLNDDGTITFTPDADFNGIAGFDYTVSDGMLTDVGHVTITVNPVNDAPVNLGAFNFSSITEDQINNTGDLVSRLIYSRDVDMNALQGIAVIGLNSGNGSWQLSIDGGQHWTTFGAVASSNATVLGAGSLDRIRFVPDGKNGASASITFHSWDQTDGHHSGDANINLGSTGGTSAFSFFNVNSYITVTAINDAPVATGQSATTNEDTASTITLVASDVDNTSLNYLIVSGPSHGTLTGTGASRTYTPALNYNGSDSISFKANDGSLDSNVATVTFTVTAINDAPARTAGTLTSIAVNEDSRNTTAATLGLASVTYGPGGGSDEAGQTLGYRLTTIPSFVTVFQFNGTTQVLVNATLSLAQLQGLTYKTVPNANGSGQISWAVQDNGGTASGGQNNLTENLPISVAAVNDAPTASNQSVTTNEEMASTITLAATDPDSTTLSYSVVSGPSHGTLTGTGANKTYTPAPNYSGPDSFTFKANDGSLDSNVATITISVAAVNDAPSRSAGTANSIAVNEDNNNTTAVSLGLAGLAYVPGGGSDESAQSLTYQVTAIPTFVTVFRSNGTTQVLANTTLTLAQLQGLTYKTVPNANGSGQISWTVQDNGGTANGGQNTLTESLSISVAAVNDAPVASDLSVTTNEESATTITLAATDPDSTALNYFIVSGPSHGTLTGTGDSLTYTPAKDYSGLDSLTFKANDGSLESNIATVNLTVAMVNDAPIRTAGTVIPITADEDSHGGVAVTLGLSGLGYSPGPSNESAQLLSYVVVSIPPYVSVFRANNGAQVIPNTTLTLAQLQGLTYKTFPNASGSGSIVWLVQDSGGSANGGINTLTETLPITINAVNDAPVASNQTVTTIEDTAKAVFLTASDVDSTTLTYSIVTGPSHGTLSGTGANLTYTPSIDYTGPDSFTFKANDGSLESNTATVNFTFVGVNDAPTRTSGAITPLFVDEDSQNAAAASLGLTGLAYGNGGGGDELSQSLTYRITGIPTFASLFQANGSPVSPNTQLSLTQLQTLTYRTSPNGAGTGLFTWTVQDNGGTVNGGQNTLTDTLSITVNPINDAPTASNRSVTTNEDTASTITLAVSDVDSTTLTYVIVSGPSHGTLAGTGANQTYTPALNYNGADSFTFKANDGSLDSNVATITISVTAVNDAPSRSAGTASPVAVNEDSNNTTAVSLGLATLAYGPGGGNDEAAQSLTYQLTTIPTFVTVFQSNGTTQVLANASLTLAQLQGLTYKTVLNANGSGQISWTVQDNGGAANGGKNTLTESVSISVAAVNDGPVKTAGTVSNLTVTGAGTYSLGLGSITYSAGGGADEAGQTLTYKVTVTPNSSLGTIVLADGVTIVTAGTTYSLSQIRGMRFKTATPYQRGTTTFSFTVTDNGGTANGGSDTLTQSLTINMG